MKFGIREVCNLTYRAKTSVKIGNKVFAAGQPVLIIDSAKTSTLEGAATTVYAQGGRGNTRLLAWEGEKTLTFTVEDALISPIGLSILTGAGLIKKTGDDTVHVHQSFIQLVDVNDSTVNLTEALGADRICETAPLFALEVDSDGGLTGETYKITNIAQDGKDRIITLDDKAKGSTVMIDCYIKKIGSSVSEIQIDAENFAGYYYVEGDTYFRAQSNGKDMPAVLTLPNVKIQSNFTFTMASSGDPSTFTYTMDAFPGYTYFDKTKKVLCVIQIVEEANEEKTKWDSVMKHKNDEIIVTDETGEDVDSFTQESTTIPSLAEVVDFKVNGQAITLENNTITVPSTAEGNLEVTIKDTYTATYDIRDDKTVPVSGLVESHKAACATTIFLKGSPSKAKTYTWYVIKAKASNV